MLRTTPPNLTAQGAILGTFQYYGVEQLEGHEAGRAHRRFAFGAVLYEIHRQESIRRREPRKLISSIMSSPASGLDLQRGAGRARPPDRAVPREGSEDHGNRRDVSLQLGIAEVASARQPSPPFARERFAWALAGWRSRRC
jgi:hypothetical protein